MTMSGASLVVKALEDEGVRFTFGIPGTHNIELYDALDASTTVAPVLVTDEQSASFMADGVSRSTGLVGVANLVPGAGLTHALSGIAEAYLDGIPLVVLACGIRGDTGKAYQLHDIDQLALVRPVTKAARRVESPDAIYTSVRAAFALARAAPAGPVVVEIPAEYYLLRHEASEPRFEQPPRALNAPDAESARRAVELLRSAQRPLIYAGYGTRDATAALRQLAETLVAPVATTIQGKGVFPEHHPLFLWNGLGASAPSFVREIAKKSDTMLAVGCRFGEVGTASYGFTPPAALIHVDVAAEVFNRNFPAAVTIAADAGAALTVLNGQLRPRAPDAELEAAIASGHEEVRRHWRRQQSKDRVSPALLFDTLQALAGPDAIFVTDSGNGTFLAMEHLRLDAPGRFLAPVDYSCMGYSVPAAIGAKLANPGRSVVALAGDGALLMTGLELLTAAAYRAGVVVCVLRDGELAQIAQFQRTAFNRATASVLHPFEVEALARTTGCRYLKVADDGMLHSALEHAFNFARGGMPVMVEVAIDYSHKTYFTRGVVATNFWRLPWRERLRMLARAVACRIVRR
jgi:acetolactate synthase I/II/III large subunit